MAHQVFLSYAHEDRLWAKTVAQTLQAGGFAPWFDVWNVFPGDNWAQAVAEAIASAEAIVMLLSPSSVDSHVIRDFEMVISDPRFEGRFFPVLIKDVSQADVPWVLHHIPHLDARGLEPEESAAQIVNMLREAFAEDEQHVATQ